MSVSKRKAGFSLIELLVVISIMGILLALGSVSFAGAQQRGRDAKRRSDMSAIQKGFEQYFVDNGSQYATCGTMGGATIYFPAGLPSDPQPTKSYTGTCSATTYCYCAQLEITGSGNSTNASCAFASSGSNRNYYCVSALQ